MKTVSNKTLNIYRTTLIKKTKDYFNDLEKRTWDTHKLKKSILACKLHMLLIDIPILWTEDSKVIGFYNPDQMIIALHTSLSLYPIEEGMDVLKHELVHAHFHINKKMSDEGHGKEFKKFCKIIECCPNAKGELGNLQVNQKNDIADKIKKLMSLANSKNENEAKLALKRADQLIQKYNLSVLKDYDDSVINDNGGMTLMKVQLGSFKRITEKYRTISAILRKYGVYIIYDYYSYDSSIKCISVHGLKANVEVAEYVFKFLDKSLDKLYKENYKGCGKGAKNSFMKGFRDGFIDQHFAMMEETVTKEESTSLMIIEEKLEKESKEIFYPNIKLKRIYRKKTRLNHSAYVEGDSVGKKTNINSAITENKDRCGGLIA